MAAATKARIKRTLDALYLRFNRPEYIHPDPLELVLPFEDPRDREIAGLISASFALGRVASILKTVARILARLEKPREALLSLSTREMRTLFSDFVYRFYTREHLVSFLTGIGECIRRYGTLQACFQSGLRVEHESVHEALTAFVGEMEACAGAPIPLLPKPQRGSSCKRLHPYLRWMVRSDAVDPGGWDDVSPSRLIVPLDVHQLAVCRLLGITARRAGNLRTAQEITTYFRALDPHDPIRYDFSMTRLGIRPELAYSDIFALEADR